MAPARINDTDEVDDIAPIFSLRNLHIFSYHFNENYALCPSFVSSS